MRQTITYSNEFEGFPINAKEGQGCYLSALSKIRSHLKYMTESYTRVTLIRFDLRFPEGYINALDNSNIIRFHDSLETYYRRKGITMKFFWAREQSRKSIYNNRFHYHCYILLDGHRIRKANKVIERANILWKHALGINVNDPCKLIHICNFKETGHWEVRLEKKNQNFTRLAYDCHYWLSYLAKVNTKENGPHRNFGGSMLSQY